MGGGGGGDTAGRLTGFIRPIFLKDPGGFFSRDSLNRYIHFEVRRQKIYRKKNVQVKKVPVKKVHKTAWIGFENENKQQQKDLYEYAP